VSGVNLAAWTPQDEATEQFYARVPWRLELTGRYHQIAKFFYNVGQLDRIINIENISLTEPSQKGDEVVLKVTALATAFHAIDDSKRAGPARRDQ
jgi:type IV pilus assembly protein PilO